MRNNYLSLSLMSLALALESQVDGFSTPQKYEPSPLKDIKPKGKLFIIDGVEIYALNEKNARRKFNKFSNK